MGLNWSAGLAGAARGVDTMLEQKQKEIDMLYEDIRRENMQRFESSENQKNRDARAAESQTDRDFRSSEADVERESRLKESETKRDFEATEKAKDRASREKTSLAATEANKELRKATLEQTAAYQGAMVESRQGKDEREIKKDAQTVYNDEVKRIEDQHKTETADIFGDESTIQKADAKKEKALAMAELRRDSGDEGVKRYKNLFDGIKVNPVDADRVHTLSLYYGQQDEETAKRLEGEIRDYYLNSEKRDNRTKIEAIISVLKKHRESSGMFIPPSGDETSAVDLPEASQFANLDQNMIQNRADALKRPPL